MIAEPIQEAIEKMRDVLTASGWEMYYDCGHPCQKEHYDNSDHDDYEVVIKKNSNIACIIFKHQTIAGWFWGYELESKLKEFVK